MAEGRKVYVYVQYVVIGMFSAMNIIALIFILINCIPVEYVVRMHDLIAIC